MEKTSVKPVKVKPVKTTKKVKNTCMKCHNSFTKGVSIGFLLGFVTGSAIVAVIDYLDTKHRESIRIERGSDADYHYTTY